MKSYNEFRSEYEEQHPSSVPQRERVVSAYPRWLVWVVLAMFVASVLLSGVHTVPTVYDTIPSSSTLFSGEIRKAAAYASIVIIELGLFVSVYASLSSRSMVPRIIQVVAFVAAIAANLYSVLKTLSASGTPEAITPDTGTVAVGIIIGFVAPLVALLSGEMYIKMHSADRRGKLDADTRYLEARRVFDADVLTAYEAYRVDWQQAESARLAAEAEQRRKDEERERRAAARRTSGGSNSVPPLSLYVSGVPSQEMSHGTSHETRQGETVQRSGYGFQRTADGETQVINYLNEHPEEASASVRDLEARIGVSKSTVSRARRKWFEQRPAGEPVRMDDAAVNELLSLNGTADIEDGLS